MDKKCEKNGCNNDGKFHCPICRKQNKSLSYFCSQECFKSAYPYHKMKHNPEPDSRFKGFDFTGPLRPGFTSPQCKVPDDILKPDYANDPEGRSPCEEAEGFGIEIKTPEEVEKMRKACKMGREVLDAASSALKVGVTTDYIDQIVFNECMKRKIYPSPLNYYKFPKSVCTSVNEVVCHGIPDNRPLENGDVVNLDITVYVDGYHGDLNETFMIGEGSEKDWELIETTYNCMKAGIEILKPGTFVREIGNQITPIANKHGFSVVRDYCGHGIGKLFHCNPTVPHYKGNKGKGVLQPNMTLTVEPMINAGHWKQIGWPDNWTSVTEDGSRSAQFEHTILITENGYEILTNGKYGNDLTFDRKRFQR